MEKTLLEKGQLISAPIGISMLPLIRPNRDVVVLKNNLEPQKYDVVLYKRANGKYILHRILDVLPDSYVLCGDNQWVREYGIKREQILAVMEGFYRDDKYISRDIKSYRLYVKVWCLSLTCRRMILLVNNMINKIRRL